MGIREATDVNFEKLNKFMELVDHEFHPTLSCRPEGIEGRIFGNIAKKYANYLIAEVKGRVAGVIGYRKNWNGTKELPRNKLVNLTEDFCRYSVHTPI